VPKRGFEPARVSPPPPQEAVVCAGLEVEFEIPKNCRIRETPLRRG
jgi:hypothetical protein